MSAGSKTRNSGAAASGAAGAAFWQNAGTEARAKTNAREQRWGEALKRNMPKTLADLDASRQWRRPAITITDAESNSPRSKRSGATHLQHRQAGRGPQRLHRGHSEGALRH